MEAEGAGLNARTRDLTYGKCRLYDFGRDGLPCRSCGSTNERRTMGSRNLFVCPTCQPR
ncbi:MAG: zinc finger domain-containing protein [Gammaproteobacteria bacterium]